MRHFNKCTLANDHGMTLVEIMVAMAVTLMVMALTVSIFIWPVQESDQEKRRQRDSGIYASSC